MTDQQQGAMAEATRLTRAGRLTEATATIQRMLGSVSAPPPGRTEVAAPLEVPGEVIGETSPATQLLRWASDERIGPVREGEVGQDATALPHLSPDVLRLRGRPHGAQVRMPLRRPSPALPDGFVECTYTAAAGTRAYKLYVPRGATGQALPLLIMLHGCTQSAADFVAGTGMHVFAEEETFLVAYPEQARAANGSACWNWFQVHDQQRERGEPSLIAGITQQIMRSAHVDHHRVYVVGFSAGGAMAAVMAATYPDLYAAAGVHSGLAHGAAHDLPSALTAMRQGAPGQAPWHARRVPMIVFHGDRDTTVSAVNAEYVLGQEQGGTAQVAMQRGEVPGGHAYTRYIYHDASGRPNDEKWIVHQAGHAWSGGSRGGSYTNPQGPDASAAMVHFFNRNPGAP
jgi:poly(hydroxyalkanoate) depolymerase family esterase